jgi:hypothetical protein
MENARSAGSRGSADAFAPEIADTNGSCVREQGARMLELRAATTRYRLSQPVSGETSGDRAAHRIEAKTLLSQVYQTFTEGFDSPDLRDAAALLAP